MKIHPFPFLLTSLVLSALAWPVMTQSPSPEGQTANSPPLSYQSLGDPRYRPPTNAPIMPSPGRAYLPTLKQFKLPEPHFVADGTDLVSTNSIFKVRIGPSLSLSNAITIRLPGSNQVFRVQPIGLSLYDAVAGTNALIAELKPNQVRQVFSNRVVFSDCWEDVAADVVLKLDRRYGFSQNIVLKGPLPDPASFGLNPKTTRLQVWSEVFESPEPVKQERLLKEIEPGLLWKDETMVFTNNKTRMIPGKAFLIGSPTNAALKASPVAKKWQKMGNRTFLIEEMEVLPLLPELQKLNPEKKEGTALPVKTSTHRLASAKTQIPTLPAVSAVQPVPRSPVSPFPQLSLSPSTALVLDYELLYEEDFTDSDSDGMSDDWEMLWFNTLDYAADDDYDSDGLLNLDEFRLGTNPAYSDSDGDGIADGSDASPLVPNGLDEFVWIDEAASVPTNACLVSEEVDESTWEQIPDWIWRNNSEYTPPYAVDSSQAHYSPYYTDTHQHYFWCHPQPIGVPTGSVLFAYVYLRPGWEPSEVMLQWLTADETGWNHRAFWGSDEIDFGTHVQISASLPESGRWVRLEVPEDSVNLGGRTVVGLAFTLYGGKALWDRAGLCSTNILDSDGDGLPDWRETVAGTDLNYPDSDYDGVSDSQEVLVDHTNPLDPASVNLKRLGYWKFNTATWVGEQGQLPTYTNNLSLVSSWSSNAVATASNQPSGLMYREYETNGSPNINCLNGTLRLWFKPSWAGTNAGGNGPGAYSRLIELGYWTDPPSGHWALGLTPDGTHLWFTGVGTNAQYAWADTTIHFESNVWHQIVVTYSPSNCVLYVDGHLETTGGGIDLLNATRRSAGFRVGVGCSGEWSYGQFEDLETFNYPLSAYAVRTNYQGSVIGAPLDPDGDGLTNGEELAAGSDPFSVDTDGDGVNDYWEHLLGRNPAVAGATADTNNVTNLKIYTPLK